MTQPTYGSHNPHPLSKRTELVWEGNYDEYGQRREMELRAVRCRCRRLRGLMSRGGGKSGNAQNLNRVLRSEDRT